MACFAIRRVERDALGWRYMMFDRRQRRQLVWLCAIGVGALVLGVPLLLLSPSNGSPPPRTVFVTGDTSNDTVGTATTTDLTALLQRIPAFTTPSAGSPTEPPTSASTATPTVVPSTSPEPADTLIADAFDTPTGTWPVRAQATWSTSYQEGRYQLQINGQPTGSVSVALPHQNYRLSVDVAVTQGEGGLVFLAEEPTMFYRLLIRPNGTYALQQFNTTNTTNLVDWTASAALQHGAGSLNRLRVERVDDVVRFFANDDAHALTEWTLPSGNMTNHYGFSVASPNGDALAAFDNLRVERLRNP